MFVPPISSSSSDTAADPVAEVLAGSSVLFFLRGMAGRLEDPTTCIRFDKQSAVVMAA